ncbi:MAG: hypothetical protein H6659_10010 [Ardenticatenaceae bacterium]|nr:hypothetical protein [Ardenticatenaceae bacterium]MCB8986467.1 hypothetical protein [Ardenticatenaceae bacterium]
MECWHCERPSHAICRFCGRAVCKTHAQEMPYIIHTYRTAKGEYKAFVVAGAVWCGECKPQQDPITLANLEN